MKDTSRPEYDPDLDPAFAATGLPDDNTEDAWDELPADGPGANPFGPEEPAVPPRQPRGQRAAAAPVPRFNRRFREPAPVTPPQAHGASARSLVKRPDESLTELRRRHYSGLRRIFKNEIGRAFVAGETQRAKVEVEFLANCLRATRTAQFQAIREELQTYLAAGKTAYRKQLGAWFAGQRNHFIRQLQEMEEDFTALIEYYDASIERCRVQSLRQRKRENLERQVEDFFIMLEKVSQEFDRILSEGIHKFTGAPLDPNPLL